MADNDNKVTVLIGTEVDEASLKQSIHTIEQKISGSLAVEKNYEEQLKKGGKRFKGKADLERKLAKTKETTKGYIETRDAYKAQLEEMRAKARAEAKAEEEAQKPKYKSAKEQRSTTAKQNADTARMRAQTTAEELAYRKKYNAHKEEVDAQKVRDKNAEYDRRRQAEAEEWNRREEQRQENKQERLNKEAEEWDRRQEARKQESERKAAQAAATRQRNIAETEARREARRQEQAAEALAKAEARAQEKAEKEAQKLALAKSKKQEQALANLRNKFSMKNLGLVGKFATKMQSVVLSRIARGLINVVKQAVTTGVKDLYKWSQGHNGRFSKAVDSILEDFRYIADILGSIFGPFIEALAPVIRSIADAFAAAAERANQFFATLLGRNGYYRALRVARQYAGIQNQLLGFDELNVLKGDNESGGGNFEDVDYNGKLAELGKIGKMLNKAGNVMLGVGAILLLTKQYPLGLAMIVAGLAAKYNANAFSEEELANKVASVMEKVKNLYNIYGPYGIAIGGMVAILNPALGIGIMLATLAGAVALNKEEIVAWIKDALAKVKQAFKDFWGWLQGIFNEVSVKVLLSANSLWDAAKNLVDKIMEKISAAWNWVKESFSNMVQTIREKIESVRGVIQGVFESIKGNISGVVSNMKEKLQAFFDGIKTKAGDLLQTVKDTGQAIKTWASGWIDERVRALREKVWGAIEKIKEWIAAVFGRTYTVQVSNPGAIWGFSSSDEAYESGNYQLGRLMQAAGYASGGTPATGTLFWAGEAGPELVTSLNGQATVYNESQLAGSLAAANAGVVQAVYDMADAVVTAIAKKPTGVSVNDVRNAISSQAMRYGV